MYAISSDSNRRPTHTGPELPELPILFHLADVSRPRPTAIDLAATAAIEPSEALIGPVDSSTQVPPATAPLALPVLPIAPPLECKSTAEAQSPTVTLESLPTTEPVAAKSSELAASNIVPEDKPPPTDQPPPVTLKAKTADRRRTRTPASEDWFASHGKFIAIAFVVALLGTVYFARTNRQQTAPPKEEPTLQSPLVETRPSDAPAERSPSVHVQTVAAVSDSKVELQSPSAPPLITGISADDKAAGDKLFDFPAPKKAEEQVAARTSRTTSDTQSTSEPVAASESGPSISAASSESAAPVLAPAYPVTTSPARTYPTSTSAPSAYPQTAMPPIANPAGAPSAAAPQPSYGPGLQGPTNAVPNYRSQYPTQPPQQPAAATGWVPPGGGYAPSQYPPSQYRPIDNTARGPRYERTGSGNY